MYVCNHFISNITNFFTAHFWYEILRTTQKSPVLRHVRNIVTKNITMSPISRRLDKSCKECFARCFYFSLLRFYFSRKKEQVLVCTFWRSSWTFCNSWIFFPRLLYLYEDLSLSYTQFSIMFQGVFRVNYSGKKGKRNLRDTIWIACPDVLLLSPGSPFLTCRER